MPLARQTVNAQGGSDARYSLTGLQRGARGFTDGQYWYDENGLSLDRPNQNVAGLVGARELNGRDPTQGPIMGGGGGGGGGGGAIPGAGIYGQAVAAAKARYQQRVSDLNKQRSSLFRQSGYKADISEDGLVTNMTTDPYNQYGAFQMLNRAQALRSQSAMDENLGRGLGSGGGLAAQRLMDVQFQSGQEDATFGAGLADQLGAFTRTQQDYKYEYDQALYEAQLEAARMAIENGDFYGGDYGYDYYEEEADPVYTSQAQSARAALGIPARTPAKPKVQKKPAVRASQNNAKHHGSAPAPKPKPAPKPQPKKKGGR